MGVLVNKIYKLVRGLRNMKTTKKVLITGSLGYIGSKLFPYLEERGFDCIGHDTGFFKDCILYPPKKQKTIIKDMRDFSKKDLKNIDAVVHLAAISNDPLKNLSSKDIYDPVRKYSLKLAKLCKQEGKKIIFASSCSVYGKGMDKFLNEESETFPQTSYSLNKLQIERDLEKISDKNFSPIIPRFATLFGDSPRMRFDIVINMFVGMALTTKKIILNSDGRAWRPNIYINDACKAIKFCLDLNYRENKPLVLNVGDTSQNYQIIKIANMVKENVPGSEILFLNKKKNFSEEEELVRDRKIQDKKDNRTYKISFDLIKNTMAGFKCDFSIKEGIEKMINKFKEIGLTEKQFRNKKFYRLQQLEHLVENKYLTDELFWTKKK